MKKFLYMTINSGQKILQLLFKNFFLQALYFLDELISGGQCPCHGHASDCQVTQVTQIYFSKKENK